MTPTSMADRYQSVMARVDAARARGEHAAPAVQVVAVTKYVDAAAVSPLVALGHRDFGENRADGLQAKAEAHPNARWHFIGNLQKRDRSTIRKHAHLVHSFDRPDWTDSWDDTPVLLQVDFTGRNDRNGIADKDALAVAAYLRAAGLNVRGLSTLPPAEGNPRPIFKQLRHLRDHLADHHPTITELSMGMSDDFEIAIEEGATLVRIGRAFFPA